MKQFAIQTRNISFLLMFSSITLTLSCKGDSGNDPQPRLEIVIITGVPSIIILNTTATLQLIASGKDAEGNRIDAEFAWTSSDESLATVNQSGLVSIVAAGAVTITAEADGISESVVLEIQPPSTLSKIVISNLSSQVVVGLTPTVQLTARSFDQYDRSLSVPLSWSSSDSTKATVTSEGKVSIRSEGTVLIHAASGEVVGSLTLRIQPRPAFEIFVSSRGTNSVKRYNGDNGQFVDDFVPDGSGGLKTTQEVAFGNDGHLYVSGRGNTHIKKYDKVTGAYIGDFTSGYLLDEPTKMTFGPDSLLYVSQWGTTKNKVARFDSNTGAFVDEITPGLSLGMSHAWDTDGDLYIISYGSQDVRKYDASGTFDRIFTSGGNLGGPVNLWFGRDDHLYVVDWATGTVQVFDGETGGFLRTFVSGLTLAEGFSFDREGNLYLCDWQQNVVNKYEGETGAFISRFVTGGGLSQPNGIAFRY